MSDAGGGAGRREVAYRLFAAEYDDADRSYSESDEERAPNYVVTPSGARVNRLFVVGVLTEVEAVSEDYLRARVVDPTGPFVVYAGQYQPEAMNFLERAEPPLFVAVTGKARTFQPEDSDRVYTSIRPESVSEVDAETRDRWVVQAAEQTVERVARAAEGKASALAGEELTAALNAHGVDDGLADGIPIAFEHYGTTGEYLVALRELAVDAARVVADERDEVAGLSVDPGDGTDDPIPDLVERPIEIEDLEPAGGEESAPPEGTESDDEPSPTDDEIDEAVEAAQLDSEEGATAEASEEDVTESSGEVGAESSEVVGTEPSEEIGAEASETVEDEASAEVRSEPSDDVGDGVSGEAETDASESVEEDEGTGEDDAPTPEESSGADDELEEFDGEFELDDDERAEIEAEYGTEFQSGSEVDDPGEADIETPTDPPTEPGEDESDVATEAEEGAEFDEGTERAAEDDGEADDPEEEDAEPAGEIALDDAVMDAMVDLDDGDGADRDAVVAEVVGDTGADPGEVEDAIQEALMDGRCYEPDDETLKAI